MGAMVSQITGVSLVYSTACSDTDQRIHQSSGSLAFVRGIHRWPVNSPHKGSVTPKMFPFDDVIMAMKFWYKVYCKKFTYQIQLKAIHLCIFAQSFALAPLHKSNKYLRLSLHYRHKGHDGVSNNQPHHCLLNRLFGRRSKKTSKLRVIGLCAGNSPETSEFPHK